MKRLGLIAGGGNLPIQVSRGAAKRGLEVIAFALKDEALPELASEVSKCIWVSPQDISVFMARLAEENIRQVTMVGGVRKLHWMKIWDLSPQISKEQKNLPNHGDSHLLNFLKELFSAQGIQLLDPMEFLDFQPLEEGNFSGMDLNSNQEIDIKFGFQTAKALGYYDIGQTVVVKNKVVLAVEGIEGTDEVIRRGGTHGGPGVVVVKIAKPNQDLKLDRPVVGLKTIQALIEVRAAVLAIEVKKVLFMDFEESVERARRAGLAIVAREL